MYYRILPELKNAVRAHKEKVVFPYSQMDFAILKLLAQEGYVKSAEQEAVGKKAVITVRMAYRGEKGGIEDFRFMSKPSRHRYMDYRSMRPVKQGFGTGIFSTSKGIMTNKEARKNKVGGEYLFEIW